MASHISFTAPLWLWSGEKSRWHFVTVPAEQSAEIRAEGFMTGGGFGSVKVEARIGKVRWRTSVFPMKRSGEYLLAVKADVRKRAEIDVGDEVRVELELV